MTTAVFHPLQPSMKRLILMFAALLLLVPLIGLLVTSLESPRLEQVAYNELSSIAQLKARQIESWLDERTGDGNALSNDPDFIRLVSELAGNNQSAAGTSLRQRLKALLNAYRYDAISIVDNDADILLQVTTDETAAISHQLSPDLPAIAERFRSRTPVDAGSATAARQTISNVHYYVLEDRAHIDFAFPLYASYLGSEPFAILVLHMLPDNFLFPYSSIRPPASSSAETLLVTQSGDEVLFLTPLRHQQTLPGTLTHSLNDPSLPAAYALRHGANGTFKGKDYRGVDVLAAYWAVGNTGWQLIAKLDRDEVMAPLYILVKWVSTITLFAAILIGSLFILLWRQQQRLHALNVEAERNKADKLLMQFLDMPFIGIAVASPQSKLWLRFNDRLCDILGYPREELAEKKWVELTHPDDLEKDVAQFDRIMRNESDGYSMDKSFIRKDGSLVHAYIDVKCVRDANGNIDYFVAMVQDITERKQAELALAQAREQAQSYLDIAGVMIIALDTEARIQMVNRRACEILGYSEQELLGKNWFEYCLPASVRDNVRKVFGDVVAGDVESVEYMENRITTRAGTERLIAWHNGLLRDERDAITTVLSSGSDITEERTSQEALAASETRLRTLVQTIPDLVWLKDSNGVYLTCNPMCARFFGVSEADIIGKTDYDFIDQEMADFFREHDLRAMAASQPSTNEESLTFASDGYQGIFETTKTPMYDAQGQLFGVLGIAHDITERKQNAAHIEKLSRLYATLSQTNQAIVRCANEQEMFEQVCRNAVEYGNFKMAWIGLTDDKTRKVIPVASFGEETAYLKNITLSIDPESPYAQGPVGQALRDGKPCWRQDFLHEQATSPWHEQARRAGFAAVAALPLRRSGKIVGCFTLYESVVNAFDEDSRNLLTEMAQDISFAIDNFEREQLRNEAEHRLSLIIKGSNDAPWDWDLVNDQLYYSPQWWDMIGYEIGELPDDSSLWRRLIHAEDLDRVEKTLRRMMLPDHERDTIECRIRHRDGHYIPVLVRGIVSRDDAGNAVRLTGTVMDLTAQKEIENQLREQVDELNRWFKATIGREERIVELKQEINTLLQQRQQPPRYADDVDAESTGKLV